MNYRKDKYTDVSVEAVLCVSKVLSAHGVKDVENQLLVVPRDRTRYLRIRVQL